MLQYQQYHLIKTRNTNRGRARALRRGDSHGEQGRAARETAGRRAVTYPSVHRQRSRVRHARRCRLGGPEQQGDTADVSGGGGTECLPGTRWWDLNSKLSE